MFQIDKYGRTPIYEQIIEQAERLIATGALKPDEQLPSVRSLAGELSINPNTLQKAYAELERRGLCASVPGNGRFVTRNAAEILGGMRKTLLDEVRALSEKMSEAGVAMGEVLDAVRSAYGKEVES
ncbi:MAG: GntR family transcriptional regulator [Clostridia bacterium]|nr:GntR family transcriptional regulator [Clostridia bacterium]